ncbi:MAG: steroid 5-alpha reductase family enzyme [Patiriisocius sp.]
MRYFRPLYPFVLGWVLILSTETFSQVGLVNGVGQLILFAAVVCLPIWLTGRMSYVDIGWPWGLVLLASVSYLYSDGYWLRSLAVAVLVIMVGLRMGLGALNLWRLGLLKKEFPRYQYQRLRWEKLGKTNVGLALQVDAISQGLANASFLALPVFIICSNPSTTLSMLELAGITIALGSFAMESVADLQKVRFLREMKRAERKLQVCDVGLWRYCRHPNYFAEWMVWNGLVIAALPSWFALQGQENTMLWLLLGVGLLYTSRAMYSTLVYGTGAIPSEHYSQDKRPDYRTYQQRTNCFFPGPRKS